MTRGLIFITATLLLAGCGLASLDDNESAYEQLAIAVQENVDQGTSLRVEATEGELAILMNKLNVHQIHHADDGSFVVLSGRANLFTGRKMYLYNLGEQELDTFTYPRGGLSREHVRGPWYVQKESFD